MPEQQLFVYVEGLSYRANTTTDHIARAVVCLYALILICILDSPQADLLKHMGYNRGTDGARLELPQVTLLKATFRSN
ncbi:hypothetical protein LTR84_002036 [Exophiala bonariae]|uniref:Uncharacterized protein n=1 Tax=Exophiala bonariae TaxID=1690606 RepID=A0AAV9NCG0_9EURO|nr:hypothetical protein LTR84_002036 [Exophiala bonariae]